MFRTLDNEILLKRLTSLMFYPGGDTNPASLSGRQTTNTKALNTIAIFLTSV
jgi:hypothetical protein